MVEGTTLAVHRCRFVDFAPAAITALCFPPLPLPSVKGKKTAAASRRPLRFGTLAVGRANGNIELCEWTGLEHQVQAPQAWVVRKTLSGPYPSKVDSLAFVTRLPDQVAEDDVPTWANLRLFSAAGSSDLVEWDIEQGCIRRSISSQGGSIWCVSPNPSSTMLALGCEDGSVRLLSLEHDTLTHFRRLDRVKSRILSLAWGPPVPREAAKDRTDDSDTDDDDEDDWSDSWLVAGCSDSCLRKWDVNNGRVLDRMATDKIRGERTLVWAVGVLGDGTIVSGDSMGMVKFWDPRTCTQMDSFNGHAADVLCLTISPDGTAVYTSGVDQKITQFSLVKTSRSEPSTSLLSRSSYRWVQSCSRRMHSHDVRALAIWPPHAPVPAAHRRQFPIDIAPILASGGFDMSVVVTPAALPAATVTKVVNPLATSTSATFEDAYHRRLAYSSGTYNASAIHLARQARLLLCQRDASVTVWRILQRQSSLDMDETMAQSPDGGWERVLDMDLSFDTNITASAISDNGQWIAVSDWYETKLFRVSQEENGDLKPKRVRNFTSILQSHLPGHAPQTGASSLQFTPDSTKLVVATSTFSYVIIIDLGAGTGKPFPRVLRKFEQHRMRDVVVGNRVVKGKGRKLQSDESTPAENVEMVDAQERAEPAAPEDEEAGGNAPDDAPAPAPRNISIATITRMAISADGQWLATTDARCRTHVFNLDSVQHHALLPTVPAPVHALAFDAAGAGVLVLGLANNSIQVYDVEARAFPRWARALGEAAPQRFSHLHDPILGVTFDPGAEERAEGARRGSRAPRNALFWGATWLCRVKLDEDAGPGGFDRKRRRDGSGRRQASGTALANASAPTLGDDAQAHPQKNFKVVTHYRPILFVDFIGRSELVVVERPLVDVLTGLPPAFFRPKYGKS
ncbi:WD40 repeat-like protein [Wolfiporia cocos MD-104 SS10]|uniref:WD40 repeat-like protein n=1 Tax=Wolfiporia cocos (strain MD-104) TaxID=742152 RepID=A0A2H3J3W4_WOLCO|nr:WD40 repeat-like protein [Wolfiporia cocos MD-104 SS10]